MSKNKTHIDVNKIVQHWIETSEEDFKTMESLFASKSYNWALFLGHISVEKLLKAVYVKKYQTHAPFIHNLYRLAELCDLPMTEEQADWLDKVTTFNLNARYDDFKREFYQLCTVDFTKEWIKNIKSLRLWISQTL
jgi:HEPN domain-containing protein